jgi:RHS repeat-associated protein
LDERWRIAGVYRESDASAKESFVYHTPGNSGYGGSGYIDDVILRDRDHNSGWTSAGDGTLEQRRYYCQNWRHDVVALIKSDGKIAERDRYLSYGTPFGSPLADATFDGTVSAADTTQVNADWGANYHVRSDFNLDGAVGAADSAEVTANSGKTLGWGTLTDSTNVGNRKGYSGYENDIAISKLYHVRYRALHTELGRWMRRDPMGYVDGPHLLAYGKSNPPFLTDSFGLDCASDLEEALQNELIQQLLQLVNEYCDGAPIDVPPVAIRCCPPGTDGAPCQSPTSCAQQYIDAQTNTPVICICTDANGNRRCPSTPLIEILWEELIHVWQHCDLFRSLDPNAPDSFPQLPDFPPDWGNPRVSLCTEIGAKCNGLGGSQCSPSDPLLCCRSICDTYTFPGLPYPNTAPWPDDPFGHGSCVYNCLGMWDACCGWVPDLPGRGDDRGKKTCP